MTKEELRAPEVMKLRRRVVHVLLRTLNKTFREKMGSDEALPDYAHGAPMDQFDEIDEVGIVDDLGEHFGIQIVLPEKKRPLEGFGYNTSIEEMTAEDLIDLIMEALIQPKTLVAEVPKVCGTEHVDVTVEVALWRVTREHGNNLEDEESSIDRLIQITRETIIDEVVDSLGRIVFCVCLEETFVSDGLVIPDEDWDKIKTIGDAVDYIENFRKTKAALKPAVV